MLAVRRGQLPPLSCLQLLPRSDITMGSAIEWRAGDNDAAINPPRAALPHGDAGVGLGWPARAQAAREKPDARLRPGGSQARDS